MGQRKVHRDKWKISSTLTIPHKDPMRRILHREETDRKGHSSPAPLRTLEPVLVAIWLGSPESR